MRLLLITLVSIMMMPGCNTEENDLPVESVKKFDLILQHYVLVLDTPDKKKIVEKVLSESYGELELINGSYYTLKVVFLQNELKPFVFSAKDLEDLQCN